MRALRLISGMILRSQIHLIRFNGQILRIERNADNAEPARWVAQDQHAFAVEAHHGRRLFRAEIYHCETSRDCGRLLIGARPGKSRLMRVVLSQTLLSSRSRVNFRFLIQGFGHD